ncbi:soluble guanylate cyclase 88E-like [Carcharodon carcharias]|uniref:soluble guanylate cyclase 88E-like n=1 Tax=Carcharodon carcharias TaxID=13397 RepID=UPI001B7E5FC1|nr:soluble guanylate cyclase 88E-like [Carcharodon carcharias]
MYGLLCESLHDFIKESYGDDVWKLVRERADVRLHSFVTHEVYSESVIPRIAMAASGVTGTPYSELMNSWGVYFLGFVGKYGYDRILKVLGRHVRDFVNGLDNLHEYLRFSYPKVQPPTFFCQEESATGVTLHYRSKRKGYLHYAMGQLRQMGKQFYDTDIHVEVLSEQLVGDYSHVTMRLNFDNSAYRYIQKEDTDEEEMLPFTSDFFFEVFPFNIVFRQSDEEESLAALSDLLEVEVLADDSSFLLMDGPNEVSVVFLEESVVLLVPEQHSDLSSIEFANVLFTLSPVVHEEFSTEDALSESRSESREDHTIQELFRHPTTYSQLPSYADSNADKLLSYSADQDVLPDAGKSPQDMVVHNVGSGLATVFPDLDGKMITDAFLLARPLVEFTWNMIISHPNNLFEIISKEPVKRERNLHNRSEQWRLSEETDGDGSRCLRLKGQMRFMPEWESIIFLGTPVMESLGAMFKTGLYINDLSMHDSSRDLVLAGTQQSEELKRALIQEQKKSSKLEESMKMLDYEMKKTDDLLYRMIPKPVAKSLRKGLPSVNTCEVFPDVTILFSDVVGFTRICSHITPMQVVSMLNTMYTLFDTLSEKHRVFKVETIGDAYMVVAGVPEKTKYHAHNICDMALDMVRSIDHLKDPSTGSNIQIRVGVHTGMVVAGVVGHKMPRFGLYGDTVHSASAMESNGKF